MIVGQMVESLKMSRRSGRGNKIGNLNESRGRIESRMVAYYMRPEGGEII
jgi:hypothetical protein